MATNSLSLTPRVPVVGACPVNPRGRSSRLRHTTWELARPPSCHSAGPLALCGADGGSTLLFLARTHLLQKNTKASRDTRRKNTKGTSIPKLDGCAQPLSEEPSLSLYEEFSLSLKIPASSGAGLSEEPRLQCRPTLGSCERPDTRGSALPSTDLRRWSTPMDWTLSWETHT
ncbi:unnamed protein product, partial [Gadus morhua 'NCC']